MNLKTQKNRYAGIPLLALSVLGGTLDFGASVALAEAEAPEANRFIIERVTPPNSLAEPMVFEVLPDGRAFIIERRGGIKMYNPLTANVQHVGALFVNSDARIGNGEQGLVGMTLDPDFENNGWMYLYYHHPTEEMAILSRWEIWENTLIANSEIVMLEWPAQRETCCHTGGGMDWDANGNLFMTVGNNRGNSIRAHTDERPGRAPWDDQGGTANSNSLEGKILRIHPEPDGSYTIPEGNLFPPGTPNTRPEIYTMGHRNAWRIAIDSQTGYIYWGEVGPDGREDSEIGPKGYDEFNQAREPGFFGWPYFVGESAFPHFDYENETPGKLFDRNAPINRSPNNTGIQELPPLAPSFVYYPYDESDLFPALGTGGRSATGGPVYRRADFSDPARPWPEFFEGKWIVAELSRRALFVIGMNANSDFESLERFLPDYSPVEPIDIKFGPSGDLYVLEYGGQWFRGSPEAKLTRIAYQAGNRAPLVHVSSNIPGGVPPFDVQLSSEGTVDYDNDALTYRWDVTDMLGTVRTFEGPNPKVTIEGYGTHVAWLTVTDEVGESSGASLKIISGNEPPQVAMEFKGNQTFYFPGKSVEYAVRIQDREDGSLENGGVTAESVNLSFDMVGRDFDLESLQVSPIEGAGNLARYPIAAANIEKGGCAACHLEGAKLVGPSFVQIADKYREAPDAAENLARKVVAGSVGAWGPVPMPPNAKLNESEAANIIEYVLSLGADTSSDPLPMAGFYDVPAPSRGAEGFRGGRGSGPTDSLLVARAVYTDKGAGGAIPLTAQSLKSLRSPRLSVADAAFSSGVEGGGFRGASVTHNARLRFDHIDLTGVAQINVSAFASGFGGNPQTGGVMELRLGGAEGRLLGEATIPAPEPPPQGGGRGGFGGFAREPISFPIENLSGSHDLTFLFRNEIAEPDATLFSLQSIDLVPEAD